MEHEFIRIPPFHRISVASKGSIGYAAGNVPYVAFADGKDDNRLMLGQCLPIAAGFAELWNPFSFAAELQIVRGAPVSVNSRSFDASDMNLAESRSGVIMKTAAGGGDAAGRRRGVGLIAKRGAYHVAIGCTGGTPEGFEIMSMRGANWRFMDYRPVGCFATPLLFTRTDGSVNDQVVGIAGSYSQAEIDAWKGSVGYTAPDRKFYTVQSVTLSINAETAVFFTCTDTAELRVAVVPRELGDMRSGLREF